MGIEVKIQIIKQPGIKSMNKQCNWRYKALAKAVAAATLLAGASTAQALSFEFGDGGEWELDVDTLMSYSAQRRVA
jgi:VCBS repeat-containing protein